MTVVDLLVIGIIILVVGSAIAYIISAKKRGQKCIGCPDAKNCSKNCGCSGTQSNKK